MGHKAVHVAPILWTLLLFVAWSRCTTAQDIEPAAPEPGKTSKLVERQSSTEYTYQELKDTPRADLTSMLSRLFWGTTLTLIACCITLWLVKEFFKRQSVLPEQQDKLKLVATLPLSRRCYVQLVEADGKRFVVAIDGGSLRSVVALTDSFEPELLESAEEQKAATKSGDKAPLPSGELMARVG